MKFKKVGDDLLISEVGKENNITLRFFSQENQFNVCIYRNGEKILGLVGTYLFLSKDDVSIRYIDGLKRIGVISGSHSEKFDPYMDKIEFAYKITYLGNGDIYYSHWEIYYFEEDKINRSVAIVGDAPIELER